MATAFTKHVWLVAAFKKAVFPLKDPTWLPAGRIIKDEGIAVRRKLLWLEHDDAADYRGSNPCLTIGNELNNLRLVLEHARGITVADQRAAGGRMRAAFVKAASTFAVYEGLENRKGKLKQYVLCTRAL